MTVNTITVGPGTLTIGQDDALTVFSSQVTSCKVTPSVDKGDRVPVLSGESVAGDRTESFTLNGTFLQDFGSEGSTTEWLYEHRGEVHPFSYTPNTANGRTISGSLTVEAIEIGGDVESKPTSDFTFDLEAAPSIGAASAARMADTDSSL
ncbi:major tail protein [Curtobacterium phage Penoan]|nr:major tail protein [Curtobacterium phage Penoan]